MYGRFDNSKTLTNSKPQNLITSKPHNLITSQPYNCISLLVIVVENEFLCNAVAVSVIRACDLAHIHSVT